MNEISKINDHQGNWWWKGEGMENTFVEDFKLRFTASTITSILGLDNYVDIIEPCINEEHNSLLNKPILEGDVLQVVKRIGALKAPGPDGAFYQNCWDLVGRLVADMIRNLFNTSSSLRLINHTNISLIPEVENPELVSNFRLISMCNATYKIITKIMVNRIKPLLMNCISRNQGAFALGRFIQDNILITHEIFSFFKGKKGKCGAMAIKLNLKKAYDLLSWDYIKLVLMKFHQQDKQPA